MHDHYTDLKSSQRLDLGTALCVNVGRPSVPCATAFLSSFPGEYADHSPYEEK